MYTNSIYKEYIVVYNESTNIPFKTKSYDKREYCRLVTYFTNCPHKKYITKHKSLYGYYLQDNYNQYIIKMMAEIEI